MNAENILSKAGFLKGRRPYLWIILAVFVLYFKALFFDFTYLDDKELILDNKEFVSDLANIPQSFRQSIFPNSRVPYYRPLLMVSFMLDSQVGGLSPFIYHLTNLIMHAGVSCLLFRFLTLLRYRAETAFLFSVIFAIHPVLSEAVSWVPGRNDILLGLFTIGSFLSFMAYMEKRQWKYYAAHMSFFALALFTKESAIVLVALFGLYNYLVAKKRLTAGEKAGLAAGWFTAVFLWALFRQLTLLDSLETTIYGISASLFISLPAVIQFIGKILMPFNLSVFPIIKDTTFVYGVISLLITTSLLVFSKKRRLPFVLFGAAWFIFFLLPSLVRPAPECVMDFQEHRLYVPIIGFFIILLETDFIKKITFLNRSNFAACSLIVLGLCAINFRHMDNFRDRQIFWENASKAAPHAWIVNIKKGYMHYSDGFLDRAEEEYKKCLTLDPQAPALHTRLGHLYIAKGMLNKAEKEFRKELAVCPTHDYTYLSLGVICYRRGEFKEAEKYWRKTLALNPYSVEANKNLSIYYAERKDIKKAVSHVKRLQEMGIQPPLEFLKSLRQ